MLNSINKEQQLFVLNCGSGFTCLGFDVCQDRTIALAKELGMEDLIPKKKGTKKAYTNYTNLVKIASDRNDKTGWRSQSQLIPELIGKEGHRVEVVDKYGEKRRFIVGKSTGFIPCHLEILKTNSSGGMSVTGAPFKSLRIIEYNVK